MTLLKVFFTFPDWGNCKQSNQLRILSDVTVFQPQLNNNSWLITSYYYIQKNRLII